jgi:hypothetical protein
LLFGHVTRFRVSVLAVLESLDMPSATSWDPTTPTGSLSAWRGGANSGQLLSDAVNRVRSIRPRLVSIGNSINDRNRFGESAGGSFSAWGYISWIHALSGAAFDRCRSKKITWNANEQMDELGCYGAPGCTIGPVGVQSMLARLPEVLSNLIDAPDVIYLSALFENDLGSPQAQSSAVTIRYGQQAIQVCRAAFPNAIVVVATPAPSQFYNTAAIKTAVAAVSAWVQALPATDPNVLIEINDSYILAGTAEQPNTSYTADGIHQNERGALLRAKRFMAQLSYLFSNPLQVPQTALGAFAPNPDFSLIGNPGSGSVPIFTGFDFYPDTNYASDVTQNPVGQGINVTLKSTGIVAGNAGQSITSDAQAKAVTGGAGYMALARVKVLNPVNLWALNLVMQPSSGGAIYALYYQGTFITSHPEGISDVLQIGDSFTFTTPPQLFPSAAATVYTQMQIKGTSSTPAFGGPSIQLLTQTVLAAYPAQPSVVVPSASPWTYSNKSKGLQQVFITGGTVSLVQFTRDNGSTYFACGSNVLLAPGDQVVTTYSSIPVVSIAQMSN